MAGQGHQLLKTEILYYVDLFKASLNFEHATITLVHFCHCPSNFPLRTTLDVVVGRSGSHPAMLGL